MQAGAVAVVGGGAVGTAIAHLIGAGGISTALIDRNGMMATWRRLLDAEGRELPILSAAVPTWSEIGLIIFATKSFQVEEACRNWLPRMGQARVVIIACNGNVQPVMERFAAEFAGIAWRRGVVTFGVRTDMGGFRLSGAQGELTWGGVAVSAASPLERQLLQISSRFVWCEDMQPVLQSKWLSNVVINTLCAKYRLPRNGDLVSHRAEVEGAFHEAWELAQDIYGLWRGTKDQHMQKLWQLIQDTAENENSMARDVRLGSKTEHEYLAGLARDAQRFPILCSWQPAIPAHS